MTQWHWWIISGLLLITEIFAPGTYFLWLSISAAAVGVLALLLPDIGWHYQFLLFGVLGVVTIALWRGYQKKHPATSDRPTLNRRGEQYVGRTFTLDEAVVNGMGKIRVDDTTWKVEGTDCPVGTRVTVTGVDGTILKVITAS